jgi:hypothetical protein
VHQGELDARNGLYHSNAVDCVSQFEIVATCEQFHQRFAAEANAFCRDFLNPLR